MASSRALKARQRNILRFIEAFCDSEHRPPTVREIQHALKVSSTSVVDYNLKRLVEAGFLKRPAHTSRGLELVVQARSEAVRIPVLGSIAAGMPVEVPDSPPDPAAWGDVIDVDPGYVTGGTDNVFSLRVRGYSMVDALIGDGDIVLLRHQNTAENGEVVAVYIEPERSTTLKRFYLEGNRVRLQPANPTMEPMYVAADEIRIQGGLVGVVRHVA